MGGRCRERCDFIKSLEEFQSSATAVGGRCMPDLHNVMLADMFQSSATAVGGRCLSNAIILSLSNIVSILGHRGGWPLPKGVQIVLEYTCMFQSSATAVGGRCVLGPMARIAC